MRAKQKQKPRARSQEPVGRSFSAGSWLLASGSSPYHPLVIDTDELLKDLTEAQRAAATHVDGPLLIVAGPGSGKTRVITRRVAYLIAQGIPAPSILAITFTNKAAGEMKERVSHVLGRRLRDFGKLDQPWPMICTFHSLCLRILRHYAAMVGLPANFSIYDSSDQNARHQGRPQDPGDQHDQFLAGNGPRHDQQGEKRAENGGIFCIRRQRFLPAPGRAGLHEISAAPGHQQRAGFRRSAAPHDAGDARSPADARRASGAVSIRDDRRIPGHESRPVRPGTRAGDEASQHLRGRRSRSIDLRLAWGRHQKHPGIRARLCRRQGRPPGTELSLDQDHPRHRRSA